MGYGCGAPLSRRSDVDPEHAAVTDPGHTYGAYGPLLNGATSVIFSGVPMHPTPARVWQIVEKYKVWWGHGIAPRGRPDP
jgi:hypothetical protein